MSRLPVDQMTKAPRGQEHIWRVIMELNQRGAFSLADIVHQTNASKDSVAEYVGRLRKAGFLAIADETPVNGLKRLWYRVVKPRRHAPRLRRDGTEMPPTKRENMWRTMRMQRKFSVRDIVVCAATSDVPIRLADAKDYVKNLHKAGYLNVVSKNGNAHVYMLVKNTGPKPPQVQRVRRIFDPNLNAVVWPEGEHND